MLHGFGLRRREKEADVWRMTFIYIYVDDQQLPRSAGHAAWHWLASSIWDDRTWEGGEAPK